MNDLQMQMMSLERHQRILAREHAKQAAAPPPAQTFAAAVEQITPAPAAAAAPATPEPPAPVPPAVQPATAPMPQLSADQAALLAASMGASLPEAPPPATAQAAPSTPAPTLSDDQMAVLMAGFGKESPAPAPAPAASPDDMAPPQTAAAMAATAIPQARQDNLRYFPLNTEAANARQQLSASDTYLRAMQQMEVNLGAYGGMKRNGR
ncbi:MAG: hypothetical protein QM698_10445 [Micropepsaceae bacterium]